MSEDSSIERGTTSPKHSLDEAVGFLKTLDASFGGRPMSRESIAEALGHSRTSSAGGIKIGSLTHFGLLRRSGNVYEISSLAKDILTPTSEEAVTEAKMKAAKHPSLYRRLLTDFSGRALPSMFENLLHRDYGVARSNTKDVSKKFRATAEAAGLIENGVVLESPSATHQDQFTESGEVAGDLTHNGSAVETTRRQVKAAATGQVVVVPDTSRFDIPITKGRTVAMFIPRPLDARDLQKIVGWIDLMEDVLTELPDSEDDQNDSATTE